MYYAVSWYNLYHLIKTRSMVFLRDMALTGKLEM
jgi:hypothetical protein